LRSWRVSKRSKRDALRPFWRADRISVKLGRFYLGRFYSRDAQRAVGLLVQGG